MTEQPDTPPAEDGPTLTCPIISCDRTFPAPQSEEEMRNLEPFLQEHTTSHAPEEFMATVAHLQGVVLDAQQRIRELESALRGANLMLQSAGMVPGGPYSPETAQQKDSGLILPPGVGEDLLVARKRKHGDVVPGRGTLVGKKITDPAVLRDLKKGRGDRG